MAKAQFIHDGKTIDYTPSGNVAAGDVVVQGILVGIAKGDIPANRLGALAVEGVYDFAKLPSFDGGTMHAVGTLAYWDESMQVAVATDGGGMHKLLGKVVKAAAADDLTLRVRLCPCATLGEASSSGS